MRENHYASLLYLSCEISYVSNYKISITLRR